MRSSLFKTIVSREYVKIIRKKSFWASTLLLPVLFLVLTVLSGASNKQLAQKVDLTGVKTEKIAIVDPSGTIAPSYKTNHPFIELVSAQAAIQGVKDAQYNAAFVYPKNIQSDRKVGVYTHDLSIVRRGRYDGLAKNLLQQSILQELGNANKLQIASGNITTQTVVYEKGVPAPATTSYILPAALGIAFFLLIVLSSNYLILALSEEKENRIIEIVTTIVPTRDLLASKIAALVAIGLTQVFTVLALGLLVAIALPKELPIHLNFSQLDINIPQLAIGLGFVVLGYLLLAITMACVGVLMPSAREAASFSGFFIFLSISPIYFQGALLTNPTGGLSHFLSYFPLTATPVLLMRNALKAIPGWEVPLAFLALIIYIVLLGRLAEFLYRFASLEYQDRVSLRQVMRSLRSRAHAP